MKSRAQTGLTLSIALHAAAVAAMLGFLRSESVQVRVESIELIAQGGSAQTASARRSEFRSEPAYHRIANAKKTATADPSAPVSQVSQASRGAGAPASSSGPSASVINTYLGGIRDKLSAAIRVPRIHPDAALRVLLKVTLLETGAVQGASIEQGSGSTEFDRSVLDALSRAQPFPPFTSEMSSVHQITLKLPVEIRPRR